jgi:tetratricopeptide (TPR) repeat protein
MPPSTTPQPDLTYHFDSNLRDIPNSPEDMRAHIATLEAELSTTPPPDTETQLRLLGTIGVYARMLDDLTKAEHNLLAALSLAQQTNNRSSYVANSLRLAHVLQWQQRFTEADSIFTAIIQLCRADPNLSHYLDFAYQHYGKSLFDQQRYAEAERAFNSALILRQSKDDPSLLESTQFALETTRSWLGK